MVAAEVLDLDALTVVRTLAAALRASASPYPERRAEDETHADSTAGLPGWFGRIRTMPAGHAALLRHIEGLAPQVGGLDDEALATRCRQGIPGASAAEPFPPRGVAEVLALAAEVARRRLGHEPQPTQLTAAWVALHGKIAEMAPGEGKSLALALAAVLAGSAGIPVHVVTLNDFLAQRDAQRLAPLYQAFGLQVGLIGGQAPPEGRKLAYRQPVVYGCARELVFDYLRDHLELRGKPGPIRLRVERLAGSGSRLDRLRMRGLGLALLDDADGTLIDEGRAPLIISSPGGDSYEADLYEQALQLGDALEPTHYSIDAETLETQLTSAGCERLEQLARQRGGVWRSAERREELVTRAITALHVLRRDVDYVVQDGRVRPVDDYAGKDLPGRRWSAGVQQLIEVKECCDVSTRNEIRARISYQKFFRRYVALGGVSSDAWIDRDELWSTYRLAVVRLSPSHPDRRQRTAPTIHRDRESKWCAVVERAERLRAEGRPVLIAVRKPQELLDLVQRLERQGLECAAVDGARPEADAAVLEAAGRPGAITVLLGSAGRGCDVPVEREVGQRGGLCVLATEHADARRLDRQIARRCARRGELGSSELHLSMQDELLETFPTRWGGWLPSGWVDPGTPWGRLLAPRFFAASQRQAERIHRRSREDLLRLDESLESSLAFSGAAE